MTEYSYFWDGSTLGDATLAPYDTPTDFRIGAFGKFFGMNFVIAEYLNNLELQPTGDADATIQVVSGAACVNGLFYENTATLSFTLDAQGAGLDRIDRVVVTYDSVTQTIRTGVVKGVAAVSPQPPAISSTTQLTLGYVYIQNGFGAASTVSRDDIHDERLFNLPGPTSHRQTEMKNLIPNSEFLAIGFDPAANVLPSGWYVTGATATVAAIFSTGGVRGWRTRVTAAAGQLVNLNITPPEQDQEATTSTVYTLKIATYAAAGNVYGIRIYRTYSSGVQEVIAQRAVRRSGVVIHHIRFTIDNSIYSTFNPALAIDSLNIQFFGAGGGAVTFDIGNLILVKGFVPGPFREQRETIMYDYLMADANWTDTAYSTGTTQIDLNLAFAAVIRRSTRGLILRLRARDSGSAGGTCNLEIFNGTALSTLSSGGRIELTGAVNNAYRESLGIVGLNANDLLTRGFTANYTATGVGTLRNTIYIVGIIT